MCRSNEEEIKGRFAYLLSSVQSALEANNVKVEDVHNLLLGLFPCFNDCIPKTNLSDIFNAATANKLWDYVHHSPVETLIRNLIPDHRSLMTQYKDRLSGFYTTTKLIEYIQDKSVQYDSDTEMDSSTEKTYTTKQYKKLTVKLNVSERKFTQISMIYVRDLWISFAEEFNIPSLTAIIDKILEGSLQIVWLLLPHLAELIRVSAHKSVQFFRQHDIIYVAIDDHVLYDAQLMVSLATNSRFVGYQLFFCLFRSRNIPILITAWRFLHSQKGLAH